MGGNPVLQYFQPKRLNGLGIRLMVNRNDVMAFREEKIMVQEEVVVVQGGEAVLKTILNNNNNNNVKCFDGAI